MSQKIAILSGLATLSIMLGTGLSEATVQPSHEIHPMPTESKSQFRVIEQPLSHKVLVTLGGIGLMGLELWWFLLSKPKSQKATATGGIQEVNIKVDGGYEPSRIIVQAGEPVCLHFHRQDPSSCLEQLLIPDFHIAVDLRLNDVTSVKFTPSQAGTYVFTCGMNMFRGEIIVEAPGVEPSPQDTLPSLMAKQQEEIVIDTKTMPINLNANSDIQEVTIIVDKGYKPNHLVLTSGKPVKLHFLRQNPSRCLEKLLIPDFDITTDLPLHEVTTIELMLENVGEYAFSCGMNMVRGMIEVQGADHRPDRVAKVVNH